MNITINGSAKTVTSPCSLSQLLEILELAGKPVVIEHNKLAIFARDYATTEISAGDSIEIISIAAGG